MTSTEKNNALQEDLYKIKKATTYFGFSFGSAIFAITAASASGNILLICILGIYFVILYQWLIRDTAKKWSTVELEENQGAWEGREGHLQNLKTAFFIWIGLMAAVMQFICDIALHFGLKKAQGVPFTFSTINWKAEIVPLLAPLIFSGFAVWRRSSIMAPGFSAKATLACLSFNYVCSLYILFCGLWGASAFQAANKIFSLSWGDGWQGHYQAAITLYEVQGRKWFYALFTLVPAYYFVRGLLLQRSNLSLDLKKPKNIRQSSVLVSGWLLWLSLSMAVRYDDYHYTKYYLLNQGSARQKRWFEMDKTLRQCIFQDKNIVACYQQANKVRETELENVRAFILKKLNNSQRGKPKFLKEEKQWQRERRLYLEGVVKRALKRPDRELLLLQARLDVTQRRLEEICETAKISGINVP